MSRLDKFRRVCYFCHEAMREDGTDTAPSFICPNGHGRAYIVTGTPIINKEEAVNV